MPNSEANSQTRWRPAVPLLLRSSHMVERARLREYVTISENTNRWAGFEHRAGDVVVCTPPKTGTTWMQGIVRSLVSGAVEPSGSITRDAAWIDFRREPVEEIHARLAAQTHRRCMKTHAPADGVPFWEGAYYIAVYRPGRDAFMSWVNHTSNLRFDNMRHVLDEALADGVELPPLPTRDVHELFARWIADPPQLAHFSTFWPLRAEPNVRILHFNDLLSDLPGQMRQLADWLGIEVDDDAWPRVVDRCSLDEMRAASTTDENFDDQFRGGATTFFNKGTNGRWKGVLTTDELAAYDTLMNERLDNTQRAWHEAGSLALGGRPEDWEKSGMAWQAERPRPSTSPDLPLESTHIARGSAGSTAHLGRVGDTSNRPYWTVQLAHIGTYALPSNDRIKNV